MAKVRRRRVSEAKDKAGVSKEAARRGAKGGILGEGAVLAAFRGRRSLLGAGKPRDLGLVCRVACRRRCLYVLHSIFAK